MEPLTDIQSAVLAFIRAKLEMGHPAPTVREIAAEFGWASKRAAECHVEALIRKQALERDPGKARALRLRAGISKRAVTAVIPLFGSIPAGFGRHREQEPDECIPVTVDSIGFRPTRNTFALRVSGDSMVGKHICDGDIVVLEHGPEPRHGEIVAALIDRKSTLKTFVIRGGKPFLKAENPKYPDLIPSEELMIQGVFRALIRRATE